MLLHAYAHANGHESSHAYLALYTAGRTMLHDPLALWCWQFSLSTGPDTIHATSAAPAVATGYARCNLKRIKVNRNVEVIGNWYDDA